MDMTRLLIVIPVYAFVVMFLPSVEGMQIVFDTLRTIDPDVSIIVSVIALLLAGIGLWYMRRVMPKWVMSAPRTAQILNMACLGMFISGIFDVFQRISGRPTDVISLITVTFAFVIAEAVFQAIDWRMNRKFDER